ncbi:AfsR/SARP family transcriptional regulator [Streptomyces aureocirculatus]|uniref:AfsR/SARP family transcriptional regulator n=1 Tax=Streptomyces aureocirculatus TaxID=67275 RepID=UPI0004CC4DFB|nr:BTAD domain-containing putative transcriptional regulator [Streptomyces aureocirculatus]
MGPARPPTAGTGDNGGVRYRVLGVTQALRPDGTTVPVGGARLRALLAALALRPGRTVPVHLLVDQVWGDTPPADATGALQALVGRLRRALGAGAVTSTEGGYHLRAAPDDVDAHHFERLVGEGTRALADGDPAKAAALLDDALALWHGEAFTDLPDHTAEAARWSARRLDARRARCAADLALGRADSALPELTALCDTHPLDEALQTLRLRALRDVGRTAEALAAYDDVRRTLADRLGTDPGPELRALHAELLRPDGDADRERDRGRGRDADRGRDEVQGRDRKREGAADPPPPVGAPEAATPRAGAEPPARTPAQGNLRARLTSFVGRAGDIGAIRADLGRARLVTLTGPGGAGKTRLSQEAAESVADTVPDGVWLAELAPVDDPDDVPEAVLTALGARETVLRGAGAEELRAAAERKAADPLFRLTEHCGPRRMLLVLDNCEHLVDATAGLVARLLAECPGVTVLATSREPLGVPGELLHPVEPLPEPFALRLLADRGASARPGFRVDDDARAAAEICRRLDGLPLAIELAAARLRMLTPRQIADRLDDRFRLLTNGARTVLPRQQTLRAVVDWSWDLLDTAERSVLRRLSVFAGGCDLAAAEAVCAGSRVDPRDIAGVLGSLVDKSLVVAAPATHGDVMRYRLLETVSEYAAERLDEAGERGAAERAHLTYFREFARTTDPELRGHGQLAAVAAFEAEYENLRTALRRAVAARDEQEALCLVLSLAWFWLIRGLRQEARNWTRDVMALGPDPFAPPVTPAAPLYTRCTDTPPPLSGELLIEARRGVHLIQLSCMDMDPSDWRTPEAARKLDAIRDTYRPGLPQTCRSPGSLWFFAVLMTGDVERLRRLIDETVTACRRYGFTWELAGALQQRANILANRTDWAGDARSDADEALEIYTRLGDAWGTAEALSSRGEAHERRGAYLHAAADFRAAIEHATELGAWAQVSLLTARLGTVLVEAGEAERGEALLRQVVSDAGNRLNGALPAARLFLVGLLCRTGRTAEAREQLARLKEEFTAFGFALFEGFVCGSHAWLDTLDGRHARAVGLAREAVEKAADPLAQLVAPQLLAVHLATLARALVCHDADRAADAAHLLAVADAQLPPGHVPVALEREIRGSAERATRAALGDAGYAAAYAEGDGLTWEQAVASAEL